MFPGFGLKPSWPSIVLDAWSDAHERIDRVAGTM